MAHALRHDTHVPGHVVEGAGVVAAREHGDARAAADEKGPFVCVGVPVHFAHAAGRDGHVCGGYGFADGEVGCVGDADGAAGCGDGGLGEHAVGESEGGLFDGGGGGELFVHGGGDGAGEDVFFRGGNVVEDFGGEAEVFGEDGFGRVGFGRMVVSGLLVMVL